MENMTVNNYQTKIYTTSMSDQITGTDARNYDPALMTGFKVNTNDLGFYFRNAITNAPGLEIHGASSPLVKSANTFGVRVGNILGVPVTTTDMPSLATALNPNGVNPGNLAFDDGTVPATTLSCRMYTFLVAVNKTTGATTLSVVCGFDFPKNRPANVLTDVNLGDGTRAIIGYLYVKNETSSAFVPGTTDLDAAGITTTYGDGFGYMAYNSTN